MYYLDKQVTKYLVYIVFVLAVQACSAKPKVPVLAKVGSKVVTIAEYKNKLRDLDFKSSDGKLQPGVREKILNELIERKLLLSEAEKRNVLVTTTELEAEVKRITENYSQQAFERILARKRITRKNWQEQIRQSLLTKKIARRLTDGNIQVSQEQIQKYYDDNIAQFKTPGTSQSFAHSCWQ